MSPFEKSLVDQKPTPSPAVEVPPVVAIPQPKASPVLVAVGTVSGALAPLAVLFPFPPWNFVAASLLGATAAICGVISTGKIDPSTFVPAIAALANSLAPKKDDKP